MNTEIIESSGVLRKNRLTKLVLICEIIALVYLFCEYPFLRYLPFAKGVPIATEQAEFEKSVEGVLIAGKTGNFIDDHIYYTGSWELFELHALRDFLRSTAGAAGVFLDIGANIGMHSLYMSRFAEKVISIEPYPPVLERFRKSLSLNKFSNVYIYPVGYSYEDGELPFYAPPEENLGTGSFDTNFSTKNRLSGYLPLVIGDRHLATEGIDRVDLIKVDIEGYERYALLGLVQTLRTNRPIVVFELNMTDGGFRGKKQLMETFPPDYEFFLLKDKDSLHWIAIGSNFYLSGSKLRGQYSIETYDFSFSNQVNMVAIPEEKIPLLSSYTN